MKILIIILIINISFISCSKESVKKKNEAILTENNWVLKGYYYTNAQELSSNGCTIYIFDNLNKYQRKTCEGTDISAGTWQLIQNNAYIEIDKTPYKIIYISEKIMTLRYGNIEMNFLPL